MSDLLPGGFDLLPGGFAVKDGGHGELRGNQLEARMIARLCHDSGWKGIEDLVTAVAVCLAESLGYDRAIHFNDNGTTDRGIWQLNSSHVDLTDDIAYDPIAATDAAFKLWTDRGGNFDDWNSFTKNVFTRDNYIEMASRGVGNYLAELLLALPTDTLSGQPYVHTVTSPVLNLQRRMVTVLNDVAAARTKIKVIETLTRNLPAVKSLAVGADIILGNAQVDARR